MPSINLPIAQAVYSHMIGYRDVLLYSGQMHLVILGMSSNVVLWTALKKKISAPGYSHFVPMLAVTYFGIFASISMMLIALFSLDAPLAQHAYVNKVLAWNFR